MMGVKRAVKSRAKTEVKKPRHAAREPAHTEAEPVKSEIDQALSLETPIDQRNGKNQQQQALLQMQRLYGNTYVVHRIRQGKRSALQRAGREKEKVNQQMQVADVGDESTEEGPFQEDKAAGLVSESITNPGEGEVGGASSSSSEHPQTVEQETQAQVDSTDIRTIEGRFSGEQEEQVQGSSRKEPAGFVSAEDTTVLEQQPIGDTEIGPVSTQAPEPEQLRDEIETKDQERLIGAGAAAPDEVPEEQRVEEGEAIAPETSATAEAIGESSEGQQAGEDEGMNRPPTATEEEQVAEDTAAEPPSPDEDRSALGGIADAAESGEVLQSEFQQTAADDQEQATMPPGNNAPPQVPPTGQAPIDDQLQALSSQVGEKKAGISEAVTESQKKLEAEGVALKAAFAGQLTAKRAAMEAVFETKTAELEGQREIKKQEIEARRKARKAELDQKYQAQTTSLLLSYNTRFSEVVRNGQTKAGQMKALSGQVAGQVRKSAQTNVNQALNIGEWKARYYRTKKKGAEIAQMARKMAAQTASQIATAGSQTAAALLKDGQKLAKEIISMAKKAAAQFAQCLIKAHQAMGKARDRARAAIDKAADAALEKIDPAIDKGKASLLKMKGVVLALFKIMGIGYPASVDISVAKGKEALALAGQQRQAELDQGVGDAAGAGQALAGTSDATAEEFFSELASQFSAAGDGSANEIVKGYEQLRARLGQAYAQATAGLDKVLGLVMAELSKFVEGASKGLSDLVQNADQGMSQAVAKADSVMASIATKYDATMVQAIATTNSELDKAIAEGLSGLLKKANKALAPLAQLLGGLGKRIDDKAADMQRHWLKRVGLAVVGFFVGIGKALLKLVAGVLIVIVALAVLAAAIGAIVGLVFVALVGWLGAGVAALVALIVGAVLVIVAAIVAVVAVIWFLYKAIESIVNQIISAATDDSLTSYERGSLAGEATGDVAAIVLPFIPKVRVGVGNALSKVASKLPRSFGPRVPASGKVPAATAEGTTLPPGRAPSPMAEAPTLPPERAPTLPAGEPPQVRGPAEAPTLPPGEAPTLPAGELPQVRGPAETPTLRPGGGRTPQPAAPPQGILEPVPSKTNALALVDDYFRGDLNLKLKPKLHPKHHRFEWESWGGKGDPPPAFKTPDGYLVLNLRELGLRWDALQARGPWHGISRGARGRPSGDMGTTQPPPSGVPARPGQGTRQPLPTTQPPAQPQGALVPVSRKTDALALVDDYFRGELNLKLKPKLHPKHHRFEWESWGGKGDPPPAFKTPDGYLVLNIRELGLRWEALQARGPWHGIGKGAGGRPSGGVGTTQPPPSGASRPPGQTTKPPLPTTQPPVPPQGVLVPVPRKADALALVDAYFRGELNLKLKPSLVPKFHRFEWKLWGGKGDPPLAFKTPDGYLALDLDGLGLSWKALEARGPWHGISRGAGGRPRGGVGTTQPPSPGTSQPPGRTTQPTAPTARPGTGTPEAPGTTTQPLPRGGTTTRVTPAETAAGRPASLPKPKVTEEPGGWQGRWPRDANARVLIEHRGDYLRVIDIYKGSQPKGAGGHMVADVIQAAVDRGMTIPGRIRISNLQPKPSQQAFQAGKDAAKDPVFGELIKTLLRRLGLEAKRIRYVEDLGKLNIEIYI